MKNTNKDRDQVILDHVIETDKLLNHANAHLGDIEQVPTSFKNPDIPWAATDKFKVAMVMLPAWGIIFPPYNIAKLVGILREFGYSTKVYDLNIKSYHTILDSTKEDYWRGERYFYWTVKENFHAQVLPLIKDLLDNVIDSLVESNPRVVGFSLYNTNINAATYFINELRNRMPDVCIVAGGPEVLTTGRVKGPLVGLPVNYYFLGEAEESFLSLLEHLPDTYPRAKFIGSTDSKLKLESYAFTDYTDYNLGSYMHPDGVSIETSRGCVAQCSFCAETYFWKFRSVTPERVVAEMQHQIKLHGIKRFWFVDSLVNGNLKSFERLIDLLIEHKLKILWNSYVRCDGRMTRDFLKKVKQSGCTGLSYGVESGSQKVLFDMRKKIKIWEIENNLRDGRAEGIFNHVNWLIGFPTEEPIDFLHSLQLLANLRTAINVISPGFGAGPAAQSHIQTDWRKYGIVGKDNVGDSRFLNSWYTDFHKNTMLHRFIRIKMFHVWLEILEDNAGSIILNSQRYSNIKDFYTFESALSTVDYIKTDCFVKLDRVEETFHGSIVNEYFSIFYALYLYFGKCEFSLLFDPATDLQTFGESITQRYDASIKFNVDEDGNYTLSVVHRFFDACVQDFNRVYTDAGNIKDWVTRTDQTKETIHEAYKDKSKKIIPIVLQEELPPDHPKRIWEEMLKKDAETNKFLAGNPGLTD